MELVVRNILLLLTFAFLLVLILKKKQDKVLNWSFFFSSLWVSLTLPIVNWICIDLSFWSYENLPNLILKIPYDLYFVWIVFWGIIPIILSKKLSVWIIIVLFLWLDNLLMPALAKTSLLILGDNWLLGELFLLIIVFIPALIWGRLFMNKKLVWVRALFQTICVFIIYCILIPFICFVYFKDEVSLNTIYFPYLVQLVFILTLPAFSAVIDLFKVGLGTPFPYDPTKKMVTTGVYAYIRNPIQWSLTVIFIPIALLYNTPILLIGIGVSIFYTIGISNPQEYPSMLNRFGSKWTNYMKEVPSWYFKWKPYVESNSTIYFKRNCGICQEVCVWLQKRKPLGLTFKDAEDYKGNKLLTATYIDNDNNIFNGVEAIAKGLEHINVVWASLGWFMRLPIILNILQLITNALGLFDEEDSCEI